MLLYIQTDHFTSESEVVGSQQPQLSLRKEVWFWLEQGEGKEEAGNAQQVWDQDVTMEPSINQQHLLIATVEYIL